MAYQLTTFYLDDRIYGLDVMDVQEVTKPMPMTDIPLAPKVVNGLINLRGQIATGVGLRSLFNLENSKEQDYMNVFCKIEDALISLQVDKIGDVIEISDDNLEEVPDTVPPNLKKFMDGVYKLDGELLSIINIKKIFSEL